MNTATAQMLSIAETISHVVGYTRKVAGKDVSVRAHVRNYNAVDERGNSIEVDEHAYGTIDKYLVDQNLTLQDIIDGYTTGRSDYKVGNIEIKQSGDAESALDIAGLIFDAKGNTIGDFNRTIDFESKSVEHGAFDVLKTHQGKGIATDLNARVFDMYRKIGMKQVTTYADGDRVTGVGRYAWAIQGFDFTMGLRFGQSSPVELNRMRDVFSKWLENDGYVEAAKQAMMVNHSWEVASFVVDGRKVGKQFLLKVAPNWHGVMNLNKDEPSSKVFDTYAKNSKGKGTK